MSDTKQPTFDEVMQFVSQLPSRQEVASDAVFARMRTTVAGRWPEAVALSPRESGGAVKEFWPGGERWQDTLCEVRGAPIATLDWFSNPYYGHVAQGLLALSIAIRDLGEAIAFRMGEELPRFCFAAPKLVTLLWTLEVYLYDQLFKEATGAWPPRLEFHSFTGTDEFTPLWQLGRIEATGYARVVDESGAPAKGGADRFKDLWQMGLPGDTTHRFELLAYPTCPIINGYRARAETVVASNWFMTMFLAWEWNLGCIPHLPSMHFR